jgi:periplasmic protein TonB
MSTLTLPGLEDESLRDLLRWAIAAAVVLGIHVGVAGYFLLAPPVVDIGDDSDAITVELAPIDSTPDAPASNEAPAPETMIESKAVPQPQEEKREETKVERPPEDATADTPEPVAKPQQAEQAQPPAPRTAQQVKGGAPRIEPSWQTSLVRQLQRAKRYPAQAQSRNEQGVVLLRFSLDRNGHVLAHSIARSSGYPDLDDEVMAMIIRAEPLPAFPPSMPQERLDLTVPIRFSIR